MVADMKEFIAEFEYLYTDALYDASENYQRADNKSSVSAEVFYDQGAAGVKYSERSLGENFEEDKYFSRQIDRWENLVEGGYITVGKIHNGSPLNQVGIPEGKLYFDVSKIRQEMHDRNDPISADVMKEIPRVLNAPIVITEYIDKNGDPSANVYGKLFIGSSPIVVGVIVTKTKRGVVANKIQTVHPKRNFENDLADDKILYLGENKKETRLWFQALGAQMPPLGGNKSGLIRTLSQPDNGVKTSLRDEDYIDAVNRGDMETAQKMVDQAAKEAGYTIRAYHGTGRADRVGTVFRADRATSGPMAYFTDNREVAERYSRDKRDTSIAYDTDYDTYETQFRASTKKGAKFPLDMPVHRAWGYIDMTKRNEIRKKAGQLREDWDGDGESFILDPDTNEGNGGFQWQLKEARGNVIAALEEQWLNGGTLFNQEARFLEVLEMTGIKAELERVGFELSYKDPNYREEKVYDTYLRIEKPFDATKKVTEAFIKRFENWADKQPYGKYDRESQSADMWDKNDVSAEDFAERMRDDLERGTSHAWTAIPDVMTDYLKHLHYDGIVDAGGKNGGVGHTVYIPFTSDQIKSTDPVTYDDAGNVIPLSERFNRDNDDIRYSLREIADNGKFVFEGKYPIGTPAKEKGDYIVNLIQNVWSKNPIRLTVWNPDGTKRSIMAVFDPNVSERSDVTKIAYGNRHGKAVEKRITLDLADDLFFIAKTASYSRSKEATKKSENPAHDGVFMYHYFVNDIYFIQKGENEKIPVRMNIDIKERKDGMFFYSFHVDLNEEALFLSENNKRTARQTLHAAVAELMSSNDSLNKSMPQSNYGVKRSDRDPDAARA